MKKYIIEVEAGKIFSYSADEQRLLKPHGDKFYHSEKISSYWNWFIEETATENPNVCFIFCESEQKTIDKIKKSAPKFFYLDEASWNLLEIKNFFSKYRNELLKTEFHFDEILHKIIFDDEKIFKVDGLFNKLIIDAAKVPETPKKFKVKVFTPTIQKKLDNDVLKKNLLNKSSKPQEFYKPIEVFDKSQEKISAKDLQSYIEEQTDEQCNNFSFKT